jgi:acyl-CoA thioester hydrolase
MVAGVLEMGDCEARILQLLIHSATGELAAGFQTRLSHVTVADARPFSWSPATRALGEGLRMDMPERAAPRSLDLTPSAGVASLAEAERMGLIPLATGAVAAAECDVFGRMRADAVVGRVSDGIPALGAALRAKPGEAWTLRAGGVGGAVLEYRVAYHAWPRAGDRLVVRSGLASIDARTQKYVHWILDPDSGRAWATAEAIAISLDLGARKVIANSAEDLARLGKRVTLGLAM